MLIIVIFIKYSIKAYILAPLLLIQLNSEGLIIQILANLFGKLRFGNDIFISTALPLDTEAVAI